MNSASPSLLPDAKLASLLARREGGDASVETLLALATGYNVRNVPEAARQACDEILARAPEHGDAWYESIIARSFGEPSDVDALRPAVAGLAEKNPASAWAHRNLGLLSYYRERDDETRRSCERALILDPTDSRSHEVLAYLAYTVGDLDGAIESGIKAVELDARNFRALHWLGECYLKLDATEQAVRYFRRALHLEDCHFFALESLGTVYLQQQGAFAAAWQCFARILSVNPRYFPVYFRLADAFIQEERLTEAAAQAQTVLHLSPDRTAEADAHQYLGLVKLMEHDLVEARVHFERALTIDANFAAAHHYLGVLAEQEGDVTEAEGLYRRAVAADSEYALPQVRLGYICFDRKEYENARRHFEAAVAIDEEEYLAHLGLSELARWRKDYAEQLERCQRAAQLAPDDTNVRNQLGTAHDALGDAAAAEREYDEALQLDPHNRQAANNLGYLYERQLRDCDAGQADAVREKAIGAWKRRLLICRDTRSSTKGARNHLERLGVPPTRITEWLQDGRVA